MVEKKTDPADGVAYTFDEFCEKNKSDYSDEELREYWNAEMAAVGGEDGGEGKDGSTEKKGPKTEADVDGSEVRVDPDDDKVYRWSEFVAAKKSTYDMDTLVAYWFKDMTVDLPEGTKVVVSNMSRATTDEELIDACGKFGEVVFSQIFYDSSEESKGFAKIQFNTVADAEQAVKKMNGSELGGQRLVVRPLMDKDKNTKVFIAGMRPETEQAALEAAFSAVGEVASSRIFTDNDSGESRGQAKIEFIFPESVESAVAKFHLKEFEGKRIAVQPYVESVNPYNGRKNRVSGPSVCVCNMSKATTAEGLKERFEGTEGLIVCDVRVMVHRDTRESRGIAHVELGDEELVGIAVEKLNGDVLDGSPLIVKPFEDGKPPRLPTVKCGNLARDTTGDSLRDFFAELGANGARVLADRDTGESRCMGFVEFHDEERARKAAEEKNGAELDGAQISVSWSSNSKGAGKGPARPTGPAVFVTGLSKTSPIEAIKDFFSQVGEVLDLVIFKDRETGASRGMGVVTFKTEEAQVRAMSEMNETEFDGRRIYVKESNGTGVGGGKGGGGGGKAGGGPGGKGGDKGGGSKGGGGGGRGGGEQFIVFVVGLDGGTTKEGLQEHFAECGEVVYCSINTDRETGESRGMGKVCFSSEEAQRRAIEEMNETTLDGKRITVREFSSKGGGKEGGKGGGKGGQPGHAVFVSGLHPDTDSEGLRSYFLEVGEVVAASVYTDRDTGKSKCVGKVTFASEDTMKKAMEECSGQDLNGSVITLREFGGGGGAAGGKGGGEQFGVFVRGLSADTTTETLRQHFSGCGEIAYAAATMDKETGKCKGGGKVSFWSEEAQKKAIADFHETEFLHRTIYVVESIGVKGGGDEGGGKGGCKGDAGRDGKGKGKDGKGKGKDKGGKGSKGKGGAADGASGDEAAGHDGSPQKGGGQTPGEALRVDPDDGMAYTFAELEAKYRDLCSSTEIKELWQYDCTDAPPGAPRASEAKKEEPAPPKKDDPPPPPPRKEEPEAGVPDEKRIDPDDGKAYTLKELEAKCKGEFSSAEVKDYWEQDMQVIESQAASPPPGLSKDEPPRDAPSASNEERKVDPDDGKAFTFKELEEKYKGELEPAEVRKYWETGMVAEPAAPPAAAAPAPEKAEPQPGAARGGPAEGAPDPGRKVDPDDGKAYTFKELQAKYESEFSLDEVREYWEQDMEAMKAGEAAEDPPPPPPRDEEPPLPAQKGPAPAEECVNSRIKNLTMKAWLEEVDEQWLRRMASTEKPPPSRGARSYLAVLEDQFDSLDQIISLYVEKGLHGKSSLKDAFFDDAGICKLGHRRIINKWVGENA